MPGVRREIVMLDVQIADVSIHIADDGELLMADCRQAEGQQDKPELSCLSAYSQFSLILFAWNISDNFL